MNQVQLSEIVKGCVSGKRKAQEQLFNLYADEMFGACLQYSKDYTEAEDTLHEGFMKVFQKIEQYKGTGSLAGWIRRVMINTALEKFRKHNQLYAVGDDFNFDGDIDQATVIDDLAVQDLLKMVSELSPKYKLVFNLYAIEGYSHQEIGKMLGISEGTSKSNLARARYVLQEKIKKYYHTPGIADAK